jgi:hypothetical protein
LKTSKQKSSEIKWGNTKEILSNIRNNTIELGDTSNESDEDESAWKKYLQQYFVILLVCKIYTCKCFLFYVTKK